MSAPSDFPDDQWLLQALQRMDEEEDKLLQALQRMDEEEDFDIALRASSGLFL